MREKLIELLKEADRKAYEVVESRQLTHPFEVWEIQADHLIASGVRLEEKQATSKTSEQFASDNHVGGKCDYCQGDREGYRKALGSFFLVNPFHGSVWQIKTTRTKPRQIYFCPMCGRKLAEPPKGE